MIYESIFMIRGGAFGEDFGAKFIMGLLALAACIYDWRKNERLDYIWVYIFATLIWAGAEILLQFSGTRVFQEKNLFGIDVSNALLFTATLQGMSEAALVAIIGIFFGDRILKQETRKKWVIIFIIFLTGFIWLYLRNGINFASIPVGDLSIPSRRDMFPVTANIFIAIMCIVAVIWLIRSDSKIRQRGLLMYFIMVLFIAWWTLMEWLSGQRWIEVGTITNEMYSNLRRAEPIIEFLALAYDYMIEVSLIYVPFLAIPYWLKLIKSNENNGKIQ